MSQNRVAAFLAAAPPAIVDHHCLVRNQEESRAASTLQAWIAIHMKRLCFLQRYLLCLLIFNLAACSTMQPVSVESAMQNPNPRGVDYGSLVEVKTLDNRTVKFRVTDMNENGLGGSKGFYAYEDMKSLRVDTPSSQSSDETWAWVLGALGVIALIAVVANADSVSVCSPSPCPEP